MCGRFNIDSDDLLLRGYVDELKRQIGDIDISTGEIYPTNVVPIMTGGGLTAARWGFPKFKGSGVIINSRAETVVDKPTFRDSFLLRRCVIPASGYYEWDDKKRKNFIFSSADKRINLCGFYKLIEGKEKFVIMTAESRGRIGAIHDRMPLVANDKEAEAWIRDTDFALEFHKRMSPPLDYIGA